MCVLCAAAAARVTGLTLSKEQLAEATARVAAAGLSDKVTLLFCDYRCGLGHGDTACPVVAPINSCS
jgi:cyclopropane fatty-acyl-phospholipid synthase-like methyltransferase